MRDVSVLECLDDISKQICLFVAMNVEESRSGLESEDSYVKNDAHVDFILRKCLDLKRLILMFYARFEKEKTFHET
jgi:hypothetical protein